MLSFLYLICIFMAKNSRSVFTLVAVTQSHILKKMTLEVLVK